MRAAQAVQISHMRRMGNSYGQIAESVGLPLNTVKSFCRRQGIAAKEDVTLCACCGAEVEQQDHRKTKRFCSDACRASWWREHRHMMSRRSDAIIRCLHCGREFTDYVSAQRKYCCHECYINARFGGAADE